jgi:hypothetical protein
VSWFVVSADQLVFIDESAVSRRQQIRRFGWAPKGQPARLHADLSRGLRYSVIGALDISGLFAYNIVEKRTVKADTFTVFFLDVLARSSPYPGPRSVVVMDNASVHARATLQALCDICGVVLLFLPAYSPDYNPIEQLWNLMKASIKRPQDPDQFLALLLALNEHVGRDQTDNFRSCGYWLPRPASDRV